MKKILLTALALLMGTFMYAQRDAAKVPGATPSKDVKTEAVLSAVKAPAIANSARTTKGDSELTYSTAAFNGSIGTGGTGSYYEWAAVFRPSMYTADDNYITSVDFYSYQAATYTVSIYEGDSVAAVPTAVIYQHQYNVTGANQWVTLPIVNSVVEIDKTKALWVAVGTDQVAYPASYSNEVLTTTDCCMMYFQSQWIPVTSLGIDAISPWMIVANTTSDNPGIQCEAISTFPYFNDFENFLDETSCWVSIDADGDGEDWITGTTQSGPYNGYNYSTGLVSKSYDYTDQPYNYNANNYLLSPEFELPVGNILTLSWYAKSSYGSFPDYYEVLIAPNGSTDINDFVQIFGEDGPADWTQRTVDISAYAGTTVRVVFHHQDAEQYWILIDNLGIDAAFDCENGYGYPFVENFENGLDCWGNFDEDGDGYTWQLAAGNTGNGAQSVSWSSATSSLTPDNWLVSPEITIPSGLDEVTLAWKVKGGSTSFREHYGVYVSTTGDQPADFTTQIYEGQSPSSKAASSWSSVTVDMTAYAGQTIRIAFRHYDSDDNWDFTIDEVSIKSPLPCNDITEFPYFNDFENFLDEKHCWIDIDNDGDGYGWFTDTEAYGTAGFGVDGSNCLISQSYDNSTGSRNADNYLLSPEVVFPADSTITLSWFEQSLDGNYPDSYEVMIAPNGSTEISDFVSIYSGVAANPWTERTADISAYAGTTVRVVFHHESSDCYILEIDNMSITVEGEEPQESELTIYADATDTQKFAPVYTYYGDTQGSAAQFVVPASQLTDMVGGQITSMKFYTNPAQGYQVEENISSPTYAGYITEVQSETMSEFIDFNSATNIFNGNIALTDTCLIIDLATPYTYNGGNLAIAFLCTTSGGYCSVYYYSAVVSGGSIYRNSGTANSVVQNYIPKTTFTYTGGGDDPEPDECAITTFPYLNDFENFVADHDCWISIDADGDGQDWITGTTQSGMFNGYNSSTGLISKSYDYDQATSVSSDIDANNYLLSPKFVLPANKTATLSWYVSSAYGPAYPDWYEVMIAPNGSTDINDFVQILAEDGPSDWEQRSVDISAYAGTTVRVVLHHQDYAQYWIEIDNLGVTVEGGDEPGDCDPITTFPYFNDFENFLDEKDCWVSIDNDGDGYDWLTGTEDWWYDVMGYEDTHALLSESYLNDKKTVLNADNYLLSPEFELPATNDAITLSWLSSGSGDYYEVMVAPNGSTNIGDFDLLYSGNGSFPFTESMVDLSAYAGTTVRVVFHHQDSDNFVVIIDNMSITLGGSPEPGNFPYLETFDVNGMDDWSNLDEDGDGHIWELAAGHTGMGAKSVSWQSATGKPSFDPDNWLISPEVTIPATAGQEGPVQLSWYVQSGSNSYPEHYGVYVSTTGDQPADFTTQLYEGTSPSTNWTQLSVDLNAYIGQTIRVAFRHYDSYDKWHFIIDNIEIKEYEEPEPVECDPITTFPYFNDFEDFLTNHDCWIDIDNDGDGQTWLTGTTNYWGNGFGVDGSNCILSQSYENATYSAYDADNYLVSPEFELPTTVEESLILSWFEQSQDGSYPDSYEVLIAPNGSTEISDFVSIYSGVAANPWTERTFDISSYAGQTIRVVFHHQSYDCYMLEIDNMSIYDGQGPEPVTCDPITDFPYFNDFENFPAEKDCWISIDNDGDGHDWFTGTTHLWGNGLGVDESNCLVSESYMYDTGIALDADNYLLSPEFVLPAGENIKLSWFAQAQDPDYPDSYEVMIAPNGSTNVSDFVSVYGEVSTNPWAERNADISAYAGTTVRVVFHHQDSDNFFVEIDNMSIVVNTGVEENNSEAVAVYPNPVKNTMTLTGVEVGTEVRIYDLAGNTVMSFVYEGQIVNVENLANGVYVLRANDNMVKIVK